MMEQHLLSLYYEIAAKQNLAGDDQDEVNIILLRKSANAELL